MTETLGISKVNDSDLVDVDKVQKDIEPTESILVSDASSDVPAVEAPNYDLSKFRVQRLLNNNTVRKSIALLGSFPDLSTTELAVVILEKQAFSDNDVVTLDDKESRKFPKSTYFCNDLKVETEFINNIYGSFQCVPPAQLNRIKATVIYPATEKHIEKYSICRKFLIKETPEFYEKITLPYITSSQFSLDWVYNILEHKQETERIVYEDDDPEKGFVLLPDLKWDGKNVDTLYLLAISQKHDIKSLRDLNATHLPLLYNIRSRTSEAIEQRYGLPPAQLRMYFHYQPSFYHLHVHINPIRNDAPAIWCEKSHMLDTVINNLELLGDYYQRSTLPFVIYEGSKLYDLYARFDSTILGEKSDAKRLKVTAEETNDSSEESNSV